MQPPSSSPSKRRREWTWCDDDRDCSHRLKGTSGDATKCNHLDDHTTHDMKAILKSIAKDGRESPPPKHGMRARDAGTVEYVNYDFEPMHHAGCCYDDCFVPPSIYDFDRSMPPPSDSDGDGINRPDDIIVPDKARRHAYT